MITKWATSIANKLAELSGEDVSADQLEIYIYGLECFLNTFITIVLLVLCQDLVQVKMRNFFPF